MAADRALRAGQEMYRLEKLKKHSEITMFWGLAFVIIAIVIAELGMLLMRIDEKIAVANVVEKIESSADLRERVVGARVGSLRRVREQGSS